jgi:hypothetical protein
MFKHSLNLYEHRRCSSGRPQLLTSLLDKLVKIGTSIVSHGRYGTFQAAFFHAHSRSSGNVD